MNRWTKILEDYGVVVALVILSLFSAIRRPDVFLQPENIRNIVNQSSFIGIVAVGMTLVIIAGGIDLSVGSIVAFAGACTVLCLNHVQDKGAMAIPLALAAGLGVGLGLGLLNGYLVSFGRLAPFIATLAGLVAFRSFTLVVAEGGEIRSMDFNAFPAIGAGGIPLPFQDRGGQTLMLNWSILVWVLVAVAAGFLLERTRFGRYVVAVGANERAARYSGISTAWVRFWTYSILGLLSGVAGALLSARFNSVASSTSGLYYELDAIAAVVIGGTPLSGGRGRVWGTVVGVLLLGVIQNLMVSEGVSNYWQGAVKGAIILLAVLIQRGSSRAAA
ncbi:MAG: ABC transporter permease [Fimbriimonadaceae bacterium]|nr:ABC transporter permease [Fimbriimonadaceae bacterium]